MEENKVEMEIQEAAPVEAIPEIPAECGGLSIGKVLGVMAVISLVGFGTVKLIKHLKNKKNEITVSAEEVEENDFEDED